MARDPEMHLRRLAEHSKLQETSGHPAIRSLSDAIRLFPFRSAIAMPSKAGMGVKDLPPITGAVALVPGVPFGGQDLAQAVEEARTALAQNGTFLILAADRAQRDEAKTRIMSALGLLMTAAPTAGRA
ncbi:hypothetical protein [Roseomonas chloroacetimidivorans]|uniref:hypothetical protein n=1 Tax=Roseomonas chloroacetimidivorans TaxID=1766656 RepID=UPI003C72E940